MAVGNSKRKGFRTAGAGKFLPFGYRLRFKYRSIHGFTDEIFVVSHCRQWLPDLAVIAVDRNRLQTKFPGQ